MWIESPRLCFVLFVLVRFDSFRLPIRSPTNDCVLADSYSESSEGLGLEDYDVARLLGQVSSSGKNEGFQSIQCRAPACLDASEK